MTEQLGTWKWCKFVMKVYDKNGVLVKNTNLITKQAVNEQASETGGTIFDNEENSYTIKLEAYK